MVDINGLNILENKNHIKDSAPEFALEQTPKELKIVPLARFVLTFAQVFCHVARFLSQFLTHQFTHKPLASGRAGSGSVSMVTVMASEFAV